MGSASVGPCTKYIKLTGDTSEIIVTDEVLSHLSAASVPAYRVLAGAAVIMATRAVVDSHIHLWPMETANEDGHAWMTPGMPLAKSHLLENYYQASQQDGKSESNVKVQGVVYVETDVRYETPAGDLSTWAKGPLDEILFLRNMIEGGRGERDSRVLVALVPWAPMDQSTSTLERYLELAKDMAGPKAWPRLKGFRFLLQAITDQNKFEKLVFSDHFIANLKLLGKRGFSFDLGIDQLRAGSWQLETMAKVLDQARADVPDKDKVKVIINHLCKPVFDAQSPEFDRWCKAIENFGQSQSSYMKLSGSFSEMPEAWMESPSKIAENMRPWIEQVMKSFGPQRTMFGSDWPVCNVKGPAGEGSWVAWKDVVMLILEDAFYRLSETDKQRIWMETAVEAYRIQSEY